MRPKGAVTAVRQVLLQITIPEIASCHFLLIYLGLMTHAETWKGTLVDKLYNLGLSISQDRVLELSTDMGNSVCARFESEARVVCPPNLLKGVFTTTAVDNIDHNWPSSVTAQGAFHGTGNL